MQGVAIPHEVPGIPPAPGRDTHVSPYAAGPIRVAALYVERNGAYYGLPHVDPWDRERDARLYDGPHPVVAHPPCERWTRMHGFIEHVYPGRFRRGDDGGCFAAALAAVRRWGGVLEHPEASAAWAAHGLVKPPQSGGWVRADALLGYDGWTCMVEQGAYGHRSRKRTWLYACHVELPTLRRATGVYQWAVPLEYNTREGRQRAIRTGVCQRLSHRQRAATPPAFRDLLISIAVTVQPGARHAV